MGAMAIEIRPCTRAGQREDEASTTSQTTVHRHCRRLETQQRTQQTQQQRHKVLFKQVISVRYICESTYYDCPLINSGG